MSLGMARKPHRGVDGIKRRGETCGESIMVLAFSFCSVSSYRVVSYSSGCWATSFDRAACFLFCYAFLPRILSYSEGRLPDALFITHVSAWQLNFVCFVGFGLGRNSVERPGVASKNFLLLFEACILATPTQDSLGCATRTSTRAWAQRPTNDRE